MWCDPRQMPVQSFWSIQCLPVFLVSIFKWFVQNWSVSNWEHPLQLRRMPRMTLACLSFFIPYTMPDKVLYHCSMGISFNWLFPTLHDETVMQRCTLKTRLFSTFKFYSTVYPKKRNLFWQKFWSDSVYTQQVRYWAIVSRKSQVHGHL